MGCGWVEIKFCKELDGILDVDMIYLVKNKLLLPNAMWFLIDDCANIMLLQKAISFTHGYAFCLNCSLRLEICLNHLLTVKSPLC